MRIRLMAVLTGVLGAAMAHATQQSSDSSNVAGPFQMALYKALVKLQHEMAFIDHAQQGKPLLPIIFRNNEVNVNAQDACGMTALMYSVLGYTNAGKSADKALFLENVVFLLTKNALPYTIRDRFNMSAWEYANGYPELKAIMWGMQAADFTDSLSHYAIDSALYPNKLSEKKE